jgi:hypothetical protein
MGLDRQEKDWNGTDWQGMEWFFVLHQWWITFKGLYRWASIANQRTFIETEREGHLSLGDGTVRRRLPTEHILHDLGIL